MKVSLGHLTKVRKNSFKDAMLLCQTKNNNGNHSHEGSMGTSSFVVI